jgi:hypothetical protein
MKRLALVATATAVAAVGWSTETRQRSVSPVSTGRSNLLYTKGASTDPYGSSRPSGFGIVADPATSMQSVVQVSNPELGWFYGAAWLGDERVVVPRNGPPLRAPLIYRFSGRRLQLIGPAPVPPREFLPLWSPDGRLIATEPVVPCDKRQRSVWKCYRSSARVLVRQADGSHPRQVATGQVDSWTPDGRLLITNRNSTASYEAVDIRSGRRSLPISTRNLPALVGKKSVIVGPARWSADGRFIAAMLRAPWRNADTTHGAIVIARADGLPLRVLRSRYVISMFAWAPVGHRLAYTTSGFPSPHELFLVETPRAIPVRLFATARHFDWITWSPDGRRLLLDDRLARRWRLFAIHSRSAPRTLRRLGGRPLWCCPVNRYATKDW